VIFAGAVLLMYALIVLDTRAASPGSVAQGVGLEQGYVVREIRDGIYWLSDGAYNTIFVCGLRIRSLRNSATL
jgi:hypothetical protein